jgi:hypothetical protein
MKDVARSVVMGAGMISPALLQACATNQPTTTAPLASGTATAEATAVATSIPTAALSASVGSGSPTGDPSAPPTTVVRPRPSPTGTNMPTRGFAGAVRARG